MNAPLDYDTPPNSYKFIIRATDGAGASDTVASTMSLIINLSDVNDHVPKFSSSVVVMKVVENVQAGTEVGSVLATDQGWLLMNLCVFGQNVLSFILSLACNVTVRFQYARANKTGLNKIRLATPSLISVESLSCFFFFLYLFLYL